jgi:hypothetical protein
MAPVNLFVMNIPITVTNDDSNRYKLYKYADLLLFTIALSGQALRSCALSAQ